MSRRAMALVVVSGLLTVAGGCNVWHAIVYDPFGPNTLCDGRRCGMRRAPVVRGPDCDGEFVPGPIRGRVAYGPMLEPVGDCGDDCGGPVRYGACGFGPGPLSCLFALFHPGTFRQCGPVDGCGGCGERYWGDWYGDPPECCDPCDQFGNFTGGGWYGSGGYAGGPPMAGPGAYEDVGPAPRPAGCRNCGQGGYASRGYYGPRPPAQVAATSRPPAKSNPPSGYASGPYRPRVISTSDREVKPAAIEQTPHLAQPQRADSRLE
jgi:hypothetical protein